MSFSSSISAALSGLNAASRKAEVVSSNISNATTDGYGRRSLSVSTARLGGVQVDGVVRHMDRGIVADRRLAEADIGAGTQTADVLERLERMLGEIGGAGALTTRVSELETAIVSATADPASEVRLRLVVDQLTGLTAGLNAASDGIQSLRAEAETDIAAQVRTLNASLARVESLNAEISVLRGKGVDPSSLLDQRQRTVDTVSRIMPVREMDRGSDRIALMTPSGQMLLDRKPAQIGFVPATYMSADMTLASGGLNGLTVNGEPVPGAAGKMGGGTLGSAFELRDEVLTGAQSQLDALARDLVGRFRDPATDPSLAAGAAGLLTDAGAAFDPADTDGLAGRIAVNAAVDPGRGGDLFRIRDGIGAAGPGVSGSTAQLGRWLDALQQNRTTHAGGGASSAAGHLASFMSELGAARVTADSDLAFHTARWETLKEAELANGVDTDAELQTLLQIEQAYTANAKVLQTVDQMMQRLLEI